MESGNRDLMDILLRGEANESNAQSAIEGFGQQFSAPVSMSGNVQQHSLTSPMGQQGTRFHAMSPSQMVPQSSVVSMMQPDLMSSQYSQPSTSYSDSNYQTFQDYSSQQRMAHSQATSPMGMFQNYGQNGSFMGSMGQYGGQNRVMGHQGGMSNQYPTSTSAVNYGNANYYSEVYPSVPPKSPVSHQQMPGSGYTMPVGGNGGSYPGSGYAGQSSMSPMQKQMGQSFFSPRSPAASQIHSSPNVTGNYPGQPPTSPMAQPLVGHARRSSTSPVSPMMPQGMPVYSMPQRQQQYTPTSSTTTQSQLQRSCMFAQRLEKMSAQHQYQAQMGSTTTLPGPTSTNSRRPSFPGQQTPLPGKPPMKSPTGSVSPARHSPPSLGKSPPPFKPLRSPPPYQAKKSPPSFQTPLKPVPYSPQGKSDTHKEQMTSGANEITTMKKAKKSKAEKSSMQKLEEVAEKVSPHLAEELSHAVGDAIERKQMKKKNDTKSDDNEQENSAAEVKTLTSTLEDSSKTKKEESKDQALEGKISESSNNEKEGKDEECKNKADESKIEIKDSEVSRVEEEKNVLTDDKEKVSNTETVQNKGKLNQENGERQKKDKVVEKQTENKIEKVAENAEKEVENEIERAEVEDIKGKQIESVNGKEDETKNENQDTDADKTSEKTILDNAKTAKEESTEMQETSKIESSKETKIQVEKIVIDSKPVKSSPSEKSPQHEGELSKDVNMATISKTQVKQSVSISRSGHTPTIQATVIAKGQSAHSNQQVLVAKTAGGQMYLIQGNVLIPVQNITVQQPKGEKGNKVICVNQGQGKSSHVMVGNITPNLQKETTHKALKSKEYVGEDDDDDLDNEIDEKMEIDLACREKTLLSPTAEMTENDILQEPNTSTVSIQTEKQIIKTKAGFQRVKNTTETTKSGLSSIDNVSNIAMKKEKELFGFEEMGESSSELRKRIGRPPGSKDKNKRRPYMYKKIQPIEHQVPKQNPSSTTTKSPSKEKYISETRSHKRPHSINVPTVSKATKNNSKRPKITPPPISPTKTLLVQPRGGVDGDAWVCAFCGKPSNHNSLGILYGPYKAKLSRDISDKDCRSPDKVMSPGSRLPELPTDLEGSSVELWIHKDCGVWSQGVYMLGRTLYGLEQAVESAASHNCSTCTELGATLQCFKRGCTSIFHFACARDSGCAFIEDNFTIFCSAHK
ncbi:uncharacterized protein LOC116286416 isoform X2 [Actinia tenebrosa]|nr:uncharacterized protein LOC116286416 isoform X2 [Actinia tenebrosa]